MIFVCNSCNRVDIVKGKDFIPNEERKCPECQTIMVLKSTNTNNIKIDVIGKDDESNNSIDHFKNIHEE